MKGITRRDVAFALLACCLAVVVTMFTSHSALAAGVTTLAYIAPQVVARRFDDLNYLANPVEAGQGEAISSILYDTQTYTSAATTQLTYFAAAQTDRTLSNMGTGGQLPDPQWFEIHNLGFDILADGFSSAVAETGIYDDIQKLMLVGRPIFTLSLSDKQYGPFPLSFLHTSGGAVGVATGTFAAGTSVSFANNSVPDGGWNWRGSVIIPPKVSFNVTVQWANAQTLAAGNPALRFWMSGVLQRRVL